MARAVKSRSAFANIPAIVSGSATGRRSARVDRMSKSIYSALDRSGSRIYTTVSGINSTLQPKLESSVAPRERSDGVRRSIRVAKAKRQTRRFAARQLPRMVSRGRRTRSSITTQINATIKAHATPRYAVISGVVLGNSAELKAPISAPISP